jgi:sugar phosphate isomerase/epimerase
VTIGSMIYAVSQMGDARVPFYEALSLVRQAGCDRVSLLDYRGGPVLRGDNRPATTFLDAAASDPEQVHRACRQAGLELGHIHMGAIDASTDDTAQASAAVMRQAVDVLLRYGLKHLSFSAGPGNPEGKPHAEKRPVLLRLADTMNRTGDHIGDRGVLIAVDVHFHALVETVEDIYFLVDHLRTPVGGICLNTGHLTSSNQEGWRVIEERPDCIAVLAWKDHRGAGAPEDPIRSVRLGAGDLPIERYVAAAKRHRGQWYDVIGIEHEPWDQKVEALAHSVHLLRRLWAQT